MFSSKWMMLNKIISVSWLLFTLFKNIIGYVPFLVLLYTLPININGYVPFLLLLYTLPKNINGYVPFLLLLYTLPKNINGYVPFLLLLYTLPMNINMYIPFLINTLDPIVTGLNNMLSRRLLGHGGLTWVSGKPSIHVTRLSFGWGAFPRF